MEKDRHGIQSPEFSNSISNLNVCLPPSSEESCISHTSLSAIWLAAGGCLWCLSLGGFPKKHHPKRSLAWWDTAFPEDRRRRFMLEDTTRAQGSYHPFQLFLFCLFFVCFFFIAIFQLFDCCHRIQNLVVDNMETDLICKFKNLLSA